MAPTILVAGATGNTGRKTVETLSTLLTAPNTPLPNHRILALTRSLSTPTAQHLASLPNVSVFEKNWVDIDAAWLRSHDIVRAFVAPHNEPTQFAEETTFHLALLHAGVQYVVRISTTAANVRPDCAAYYARQHWAVETLLGTPEFAELKWTSLQPNVFTNFYLAPVVEFIRAFRASGGKQPGTLRLMAAPDAPVGLIDPDDVGVVAAHLLCERDTARHSGKKYVVSGPEDVTGQQTVQMVEEHIGEKVESVSFKDMSFIEGWAEASKYNKSVILSVKHAAETAWEGKCSASTTSKEVLELAAPKRTVKEGLRALLGE